jgi:hypothetical protein
MEFKGSLCPQDPDPEATNQLFVKRQSYVHFYLERVLDNQSIASRIS